MYGNLSIAEPAWAGIVLAVAGTLWALRVGGARRALAIGPALAAAALLLVLLGTRGGALLLLIGAAVVLMRLAALPYSGAAGGLSTAGRRCCAALRGLACVGVLLIAARPGCDWTRTEWLRPAIVILLDDSRSLRIQDLPRGPARVARLNAALRDAAPQVRRLAEIAELHIALFGESVEKTDTLEVSANREETNVAGALASVAALRSEAGEPPLLAVLVSDGANNATAREAVLEAAGRVADVRCGVLCAAAGPNAEDVAELDLSPLMAPGRVPARTRVQVGVAGVARRCAGAEVRAEVYVGDRLAGEARIPIARDEETIRRALTIEAPEPGVHRLSVRLIAPAARGGAVVERSTTLEVGWDRIRVLFLAAEPQPEFAFAARALRGDPRFEATIGISGDAGFDRIVDGFDVVVLGAVPGATAGRLAPEQLAADVTQRGVGLLVAGGVKLLNEGDLSRSPLRQVCPTSPILRARRADYRPALRVTPAGLRHPIFASARSPDAPRTAGEDLRLAAGAARLGEPAPLAQTLAVDEEGDPLLVVQEYGRGRAAVAAWEATWPWALESDAGSAFHRALWRELIAWLANRRPTPWVLTDAADYASRGLATGSRSIEIRAGIAGLTLDELHRIRASARLTLAPLAAAPPTPGTRAAPATQAGAPALLLRWADGEWRAGVSAPLSPGRYRLAFEVDAPLPEEPALRAETEFVVRDVDAESLPPTADHGLLREIARRTADFGGAFIHVDELSEALGRLAEADRRRRVERAGRAELGQEWAPATFALIAALFVAEWAVRRRSGAS